MNITHLIAVLLLTNASLPSQASEGSYRAALERSGCTPVTEIWGCDINKSREQNLATPPGERVLREATLAAPFVGEYLAQDESGQNAAELSVSPNGLVAADFVRARPIWQGDTLQFQVNAVIYTINRQHGGYWIDHRDGSQGKIIPR